MQTLPRISGRRNQTVALNVTFYRNGVPTDPYAIRRVEIYHTSVMPGNLIVMFPFLNPADPLYPAPAVSSGPGEFILDWLVPPDIAVPDVHYDVWYYFADNPITSTGPPNLDDPAYADQLLSSCNRFWLYPDGWVIDDGLQCIRLGFEPLDQRFQVPEVRCLEVGMMPLPLYAYNYNLVQPLLPMLTATIDVETVNNELLVSKEPMTIGLRQGPYRTNPYVLRWMLDTSRFLRGSYRYRTTVYLPNGQTRTSPSFVFTVA